jgi:hypothetical protein
VIAETAILVAVNILLRDLDGNLGSSVMAIEKAFVSSRNAVTGLPSPATLFHSMAPRKHQVVVAPILLGLRAWPWQGIGAHQKPNCEHVHQP